MTNPAPLYTQASFTREQILSALSPLNVPQWTADSPGAFTLNTDSRTLTAGQWFIPIVGERFDGHDFVVQALDAGAAGVLVDDTHWAQHPDWHISPNIVVVADTTLAYLALAGSYRQRFPKLKVVALTGSSGKTTTKSLLHAAFSALCKTQATDKNFNNDIGVAQTLLSIQPDTEVLIVEMGMRGPGQIRRLTGPAGPNVALVTNVGPAHIEFLGSLEAIAQAKSEIFEGLSAPNGIAIANGDDAVLLPEAQRVCAARGLTLQIFSKQTATNVLATVVGTTFEYQEHSVSIPVPGAYMVENVLAVLNTVAALRYPLAPAIAAIASYTLPEGRGQTTPLQHFPTVTLTNDAYNANPSSMQASIEAFLQATSQTPADAPAVQNVLVLGGMNELGEQSKAYHKTFGYWLAQQAPIAGVYCIGAEASWVLEGFMQALEQGDCKLVPVVCVADKTALPETLPELLARVGVNVQAPVRVLLKASRSYALESCVSLWDTPVSVSISVDAAPALSH